MPTTRLKNTVYRLMLPFRAPDCDANPVFSVTGQSIHHLSEFSSLIRKHHVLGSATLLSDGSSESLILTSSSEPMHKPKESTFFRVASITKMATAALAMRLADRGIIDPDRPVLDCLPLERGTPELKGVTVRHLLSHTSGLTDPPGLEYDLNSGVPLSAALSGSRTAEPGSSFRYSNLGYGILGCVFESVLDKPVSRIFDEELFVPLKMNSTLEGCSLPQDEIMPVTRILPYKKDSGLILTQLGQKPLVSPDPVRHYGHSAGSMYTDIRSLKTLLLELMDNRFGYLSDHALAAMKTRHAEYGKISPSLSYGLGLLLIHDPAVSSTVLYGHQGFAYGCADGAFWDENTGRIMITLNGGCSEARNGRLGSANRDFLIWSMRKEFPSWRES